MRPGAREPPAVFTVLEPARPGRLQARRTTRGRAPAIGNAPAVTAGARPLAMFPLSTVLFPLLELPLHVFEPRYQVLLADCLAAEREFGVVLIDRGSEVGGGDRRVQVGTVARIESASPMAEGRWLLATRGTRRVRVTEWLPDDPYPVAVVEELPAAPRRPGGPALEVAQRAVRRARALLSELGPAPALVGSLELGDDADEAAWRLCAMAPVSPLDGQRLLEIDEPVERLGHLAELCDAVADDLSRMLADGRE